MENNQLALANVAKDLDEQQLIFIAHYIRCFDIVAAGNAAGYEGDTAHKLLKNLSVRKAINAALYDLIENNQLLQKQVLQRLAKIAFFDVGSVLSWNGRRIVLKNSSEVDTTCVKSIKETKDGISVEFHNQLDALEKLGRYLKIFNDSKRLELEGNIEHKFTITDLTRAVQAKIDQVLNDNTIDAEYREFINNEN